MLKSRIITCPRCGAMMEVTNPNLQSVRDVNCPNPNCKVLLHVNFDDGETVLAEKKERKDVPGQLVYNNHSPLYLKEGKNTVGRADSKHTADLGLEVNDQAMSRLHCLIEVHKLSTGMYKAVISDLRDETKINKMCTEINGEPLMKEDKMVLDDGDSIKMGNTVIRYRQK